MTTEETKIDTEIEEIEEDEEELEDEEDFDEGIDKELDEIYKEKFEEEITEVDLENFVDYELDEITEQIGDSTSPYHTVDTVSKVLEESGFIQLIENKKWELEPGNKYYITRNESSIIAFTVPEEIKGINMVQTHTDSPAFRIKMNPEIRTNGYLKLNTAPYGGMINYTWFDRPLSIAGRAIINDRGTITSRLLDIMEDVCVIPSQAIHINSKELNEGFSPNLQNDMLPILSLKESDSFKDIIMTELFDNYSLSRKSELLDYDLYLYNTEEGKTIGNNGELLMSPRLDDLASVFTTLKAYKDIEDNDNINMFCAFNNEEIGSNTNQGADSTFLSFVLAKIGMSLNIDINSLLRKSVAISADNAHATHPNALGKADPTNKVYMNQGIAIKHHQNYSTDGYTAAIMKEICNRARVPYQDYEHRSDMRCGGTLGVITQSHIPVDSVDIGIPQLAMHSANETCGVYDLYYMYKAMEQYYNSTIEKEEGITFIR